MRELERPEQVAARVLESAIAGHLAAEDVPATVAAEQSQQAAAVATAVALTQLRREARTELIGLESSRTASRHLLDDLDRRLGELLDRAAGVLDQLGAISDAETAAEAGQLDAWRDAQQLAGEYRRIRSTQAATWQRADALGRSLQEHALSWLETPERVDRELLARRAQLPVRVEDHGGGWHEREPAGPPWPSLDGRGDNLAAIRWLVANPEGGPWVPTVERLNAADATLREHTRAFVEEQQGAPSWRARSVRQRDRAR